MQSTLTRLRWTLTLVIIAAMVLVSLLPDPYRRMFSTAGLVHVIVHVIAFFVLGMLGAGALPSLRRQLLFMCGLILAGCLMEALQGWFYRNPIEYEDIAADAVGVGLALLLTVTFRWAKSYAARSA